MTFPALELTSAIYTGVLRDAAGNPVSSSVLQSFSLTVYEVITQTIVNSRNSQDVLNTNDVTVDTNGLITWYLQKNDNAIVAQTEAPLEIHVAKFVATWTDVNNKPQQLEHEVFIAVQNLGKTP